MKFGGLYFLLGCVLSVEAKRTRFLLNNGGDPVSCNFESGFCQYTQQHNDNYDWSIGQGRTHSGHTGPNMDHSPVLNGHYAYIDSSEHNAGKKARIISPAFDNPTLDHYRVQFWYDMEGRDIGTLNVYVRDHGASLGAPLLSLTGEQSVGWHQACLDIPHDYDRFQLIFEGIGDGNRGDIAIDDIALGHGSCNISVRNISCDFDTDNCGYELYWETGYKWQRHQYGTPSRNTGPSRDHTGHGYYLYAEADNGQVDDTTAIISPAFETGAEHYSVQFWYHMYGHAIGELRVLYMVGEREGDDVLFSEGWENKGNQWHAACFNLPLYSHNIRLVFESVRGQGHSGDIAIDDIKLQPGFCKESHIPHPTAGTSPVTAPPAHWSRWSAYSACSVTCGSSVISMSSRTCVGGGNSCPGQATRTRSCSLPSCAAPTANWSNWSAYSACSVTCGSSVVSMSSRTCVGGNNCPGEATRTRSCSLPNCAGPVDGHWSDWATWSACSKSCELGHISRTRSCDHPAPSNGGKTCQGTNGESKDCSMGPCPRWTHWFEGPCSSSCGNGTMERLRTCSSGHVEDCTGESYQLVPCAGVTCIE